MSEEKNTRTVELEPEEIVVQVSCLENLYRTGAFMEELTRGSDEPRKEFLDFVRETLHPGPYVSIQVLEDNLKLGRKVFRSDSVGMLAHFEFYTVDAEYGLWEDENATMPVLKLNITGEEGRCVVLLAHWWHYDYLIPE